MLLVFVDLEDTRNAILLAAELWSDGIAAYLPNLTSLQAMVSPRPDEEWIQLHGEFLKRCDALLALGDCEITTAIAKEAGLPVFRSYKDLLRFSREGTTDE